MMQIHLVVLTKPDSTTILLTVYFSLDGYADS